jgi:hypothetical protein
MISQLDVVHGARLQIVTMLPASECLIVVQIRFFWELDLHQIQCKELNTS